MGSVVLLTLHARVPIDRHFDYFADVFYFFTTYLDDDVPAKTVNRLALNKQENYKFEYLFCRQSN